MAPNTTVLLVVFVVAFALFLESEAVPLRQVELLDIPNIPPMVDIKESEKNPTLTSICQKTYFFDECVATLEPVLKGNPVSPAFALKAEINIAGAQLHLAKKLIDIVTNKPATSLATKQCLLVCSENFDSAINGLEASLQAIAGRDHDNLISTLGGVITYIQQCDDAYAVARKKSSVSAASSLLGKIASNCFTIAQQVHL